MYERVLIGLLNYPWVATSLGSGLFSLGGLMFVLGLRVDKIGRRIGRVFGRHGLETPDVMAAFPWWLRMLTPESAGDWVLVALILAVGACLLYLGKWARKQFKEFA